MYPQGIPTHIGSAKPLRFAADDGNNLYGIDGSRIRKLSTDGNVNTPAGRECTCQTKAIPIGASRWPLLITSQKTWPADAPRAMRVASSVRSRR